MTRLYIRIYLTVIGSLVVFALLAGIAGFLMHVVDDDPPWRQWPNASVEIAERMLPADQSPVRLQSELEFWRQKSGFNLMLRSAEGEFIAQAGDFPRHFKVHPRRRFGDRRIWRGRGGLFGLTLNDGRQLIAIEPRPERHFAWLRHFSWLGALLGIALAVGISAYPLIRYMSRRLERLEQGVAAFGDGDLSTRVEVSGRDEIAKLATTFNASADRIEALLLAHKTLLANASHELRSPLSRLRMAIEKRHAGENDDASAAEIRRNIEELDTLVEEILLSSRLQANTAGELQRTPVDLVGLLAEECAPYDADLNVPGRASPIISGDARLLRRLFRNLLENAARYGRGKPAEVTIETEANRLTITVCDRGPGVPEAECEKIFEPFYRLKNASESAGGVGLGLALVKKIAEGHDGSVRCYPRPDGGSCFEVILPAG